MNDESKPVYPHFKFEIGQFVETAHGAESRRVDRPNNQYSTDRMQVLERIYQECPGGVQLHYICRPQGFWIANRDPIRLNEIELVAIEDQQIAKAPITRPAQAE